MKKAFSLLLAAVVLMGLTPAIAQTIQMEEDIPTFDVSLTIPEGATITQEDNPGISSMTIALSNANGRKPQYMLTVAYTEEIDDDKSMADFTEDEKDNLVALWEEAMEEPTYVYDTLPDGNLVLLMEENTEENDFAFMITMYHGYFIHLYMAYEDYDKLTAEDLETMYEMMNSIVITQTDA